MNGVIFQIIVMVIVCAFIGLTLVSNVQGRLKLITLGILSFAFILSFSSTISDVKSFADDVEKKIEASLLNITEY